MLSWRLFGINFCIQPSFWLMSAIFGYLVVGMGLRKSGGDLLTYIGLWIVCTLVSVMVHELGHAVTGRIFGQQGNITLAGMGGQAAGNFETLKVWQRVLVILAGPGAGFLFVAALILVNRHAWNDHVMRPLDITALRIPWEWDLMEQFKWHHLKIEHPYAEIMMFLFWMNLFWNIINLVPIIPLDGGMLLREGCTIASPVWGLRAAFGLSFLLAAAVTIYCILALTWRREWPTIIDPFFGILMFGMMAAQNFMSMLQVRGTPQRTPYHDREDD
jgi:hypothetical protein